MKTTQETLLLAKQLVIGGWCKGKLKDEDGRVCILGALSNERNTFGCYVVGNLRAYDAVDAAQQKLFPEFTDMVMFNNHPATTKADVLAVLDEAILSTSEPPQVKIKHLEMVEA